MVKYITLALFILSLVNCNSNKIDYNYPKAAEKLRENRAGSLFDNKLSANIFSKNNIKNFETQMNNIIWQAALDVVSFMPLNSVDSNSGIIVTDWYNDPNASNERFKANIRVTSDQLKVNSVKVIIFKQIIDNKVHWIDSPINANLAKEFEDRILTKARQIYISKK